MEIRIDDEVAEIEWRNNKPFATGYDLENERIALAIRGGYGEGIGALLVAIDENFEPNADLNEILRWFNDDLDGLFKADDLYALTQEQEHALSVMTPFYLSYSPNKDLRMAAISIGIFNEKSYRRLCQSKDVTILQNLATHESMPYACYESLLGRDGSIMSYLASNPDLPQDLLFKLSKLQDDRVRESVANNPNANTQTRLLLARDANRLVLMSLAGHENLDLEVSQILAKKEEVDVRVELARRNTHKDIWAALAENKEQLIRIVLVRNPHIDQETILTLLNDENEIVRKSMEEVVEKSRKRIERTSENREI